MKSILIGSTALASTLAVLSTAAVAQDSSSSEGRGVLEEITITSQKREKSLIDTPIAVSAYTGESLERSAIRDIRDLQFNVPTLNTTQNQDAFQTVVTIRGIGTAGFNPGLEPSVGIYVDGVYRSRTGAAIGDFISLERVEVMRGPQSTLFGKNTSAGVISFITKKPEQEFGGKVEASVGNYDQMILKGTVTGPINDQVSFRLSGNINKRDGFIDNITTDEDLNNRDRWALRGQLLFEPSDETSVRIIADYSKIDERCCTAAFLRYGPTAPAVQFAGGSLRELGDEVRFVGTNRDPFTDMKDWGASLEIKHEFEGSEITYLGAYRDFHSRTGIDADFTDADIIALNGPEVKIDIMTHELRWQSTGDNKVDWLVGAFSSNQNLDQEDKVTFGADTRAYIGALTGFVDPVNLPGVTNLDGLEATLIGAGFPLSPGDFFREGFGLQSELFETESESWAVFAQLDAHLSDRLTLTGGIRYTNEDKTAKATFDNISPFSALDLPGIYIAQALGPTTQFLVSQGLPADVAAAQALQLVTAQSTDPAENALLAFAPLQFLPPFSNFDRSRDESEISGNVILSYDVNDDLNTYASYSKGYKAGGFDSSRDAANVGNPEAAEFEPEKIRTWELGLKARLADGRARVNVAVYDQLVTNFQENFFVGTGFLVRNVGDIKVKGFEVDATIAASENLTLNMAAAYNDAKYKEYPNGVCANSASPSTPNGDGTCDLTGLRKTTHLNWFSLLPSNMTRLSAIIGTVLFAVRFITSPAATSQVTWISTANVHPTPS